jgi:hypothetical protein
MFPELFGRMARYTPGREGPLRYVGRRGCERNAQCWRMLEAEARIIARSMSDPVPKRIMLSIAEGYRRLAQHSELRHELIAGTSLGPEALKVVGQAFDAAWAKIAGSFSDIEADRETARVKLATAVLSVAVEESRDPQVLTAAALQKMALDYRELSPFRSLCRASTDR